MRREAFVVAAFLAASTLGCPSPQSSQAQSPAPASVAASRPTSFAVPLTAVPLTGDAVSGCAAGAPAVKVVVTLTRGADGKCRPDVSPALVCVAPGGIIRWKVDNDCDRQMGSHESPAFKVTRPKLRDFSTARASKPSAAPSAAAAPPSILTGCDTHLAVLEPGLAYLYCTVRDDAHEGIYKYGVEGANIDPLDPDVEVRRGNGG